MHTVSLHCPIGPLGSLLVSPTVFMDGTKLMLEIDIKVFDSLYLILVSNRILSALRKSKESDGQLRGTRTGPMFFPLAKFSKSPRSLHGFK